MNSSLRSENQIETTTSYKFQKEILDDLKSNPKKLSSKYFYDSKGDSLFQKIMALEDYYLTKCELDIFKNQTAEIANLINTESKPFDLIELGAGDAMKSTFLLEHLVRKGANFTYMPIDISANILSVLKTNLNNAIPELNIICLEGEYFEMIEKAMTISSNRKVILFLGSNIGNMEIADAEQFCSKLKRKLNQEDNVLIGFDLKKHPKTILRAYDDPTGVTAQFNLNLLVRINHELGANFNINQFEHYQTYDPINGACKSYLISLIDQKVLIGEHQIHFAENEPIFMEISQKFSPADILKLAHRSGFDSLSELYDSKKWFMDAIWQIK
ncbi:L-histidine N(alpha)-methyltransferase [Sphingobacterium kitahiroshimense]|uniref:L-histidine N(Alpha)-methyltransferase n=1 Tax=Sphingobacterium kitahiroshimense TaxID=470446 RepID=A0ABV0BW91_9SPHI